MTKLPRALLLIALCAHTYAAAAPGPNYKFRVYTPLLKTQANAQPPAATQPAVPALVNWLSPYGCYHNGTLGYNPLGDPTPSECNKFIGMWLLDDAPFRSSDLVVLLNSKHPEGYGAIVSSGLNDGYCWLADGTGAQYGSMEVTYTSAADYQSCVNNQAIGKYPVYISRSTPRVNPVLNMVNPVASLEQKINSSVYGAGCLVYYADYYKYVYVRNYMENGVNLCVEEATVYYRASDNSIRSSP